MNNSFLTAAASYYGLSPENLLTADWQNEAGSLVFTFSINASEDDLQGILSRMKAMREEEAQRQRDDTEKQTNISAKQARITYDNMTPSERSQFGSFGGYLKWLVRNNVAVTSNADDFGGLPG